MADVRSLLRSERAARRITHPHSSYSATGTLICLVCNVQIKSESLWDTHLRSEQHAMRLRRGEAGSVPKLSTATASDKRKRKSDGEESDDSRKRMKNEKNRTKVTKGFLPEGFFDEPAEGDAEGDQEEDNHDQTQLDSIPVRTRDPALSTPLASAIPQDFFDTSTPGSKGDTRGVDEDEWAAFERDIAGIAPAPPPSALTAAATISAPALSASEIAARLVDEANIQLRESKEVEVEAEKEDAVRQLEEEFDEMENLEERVRRLREKRERLRQAREANSIPPAEVDMDPVEDTIRGAGVGTERDSDEDEDEVDDDGDDGDWDEWRLRGA
ncbi:hypothetical protein GP486_004419 [Trichoglossum hirsutum]|uniref:Zinc finger double-stranded RNA binding domain-containing protein n=1 Tax=Trichoglossum hirsutum TaxID=265104 RepID=A0A9P8RPR4_9PEZI|nr:hypothetical protein GP486_004419 [Trichoglossum hirsutum]